MLTDRSMVIAACMTAKNVLTDTTAIEAEMNELVSELAIVTELTRKCVEENTAAAQDQQEYTARYNGYVERYEKAKGRYEELSAECETKKAKGRSIERFLADFAERDEPITEFDDCLWLTSIDRVTVRNDGVLVFRFNYGGEIEG